MRQEKPLINRALYKAIKKYDHQQMEHFAQDLYLSGYEAGRKSVTGVELTAIMEAVAATSGIGAVKLEAIRENVDKLFREQEEAGNT